MPKMKTKRAVAKRYSLTATGKLKLKKSHLRHILTKKSPGLKRSKRAAGYLHETRVKQTLAALPYGTN